MDEARRFLRYVMPGLIYGGETVLFLYIVLPEPTCRIFSNISENSLGAALGGVLMSGVLGYIFSSVHHLCHWCHWCFDEKILDHTRIVSRVREDGLIAADDTINHFLKNDPIPTDTNTKPLTREAALEISMALWCRGGLSDHIGERAYKKLDSLGDQVHGLGTARIASIFAVVTAIPVCVFNETWDPDCGSIFRYVLMLVFWGVITYIFHSGYSRVGKMTQEIYDRILYEALRKNSGDNRGQTTVVAVSPAPTF